MTYIHLINQNDNKIPNRQMMCETLIEVGQTNEDLFVLTSDSRGSASLVPFAEALPEQIIEVGIAEQNIVSIAAGMVAAGKTAFVASPACFLSMRSIEQIKVDVAYSNQNVKLIGISGGVSYGALGMSHHSLQDIAVCRAIPNLDVMLPADRHETKNMIQALVNYDRPAYIRLGRNAVQDCYTSADYPFEIGKGVQMTDGDDITIIATGETVRIALDAAELMKQENINCRVINLHTIKPLDEDIILKAAKETKAIITIEEHSICGGLGAAVSEVTSQQYPTKMRIVGIPDEPAITGTGPEVFEHYGLTKDNLTDIAEQLLKE